MPTASTDSLLTTLVRDGIVVLPGFVSPSQLPAMRRAFESRLQHQRWNDVDGYEKTEPYRHMVQDVLTLEQGFVDAALHPLVKGTLREYLGPNFELEEAKGWKSLPTRRDFHGWHGDAWYDQKAVPTIQREVKLALYLTDVTSGFFEYVKGTHGKQHPRRYRREEAEIFPASQIVAVKGDAGCAFLFDTSGLHRQSVPILESRYAVFYNYHDPSIPLQAEDLDYYRYHPLLLNAAFLGGLESEDRRILGFGNKQNYIPDFTRRHRHPGFQRALQSAFDAKLRCGMLWERVRARGRRLLGR